MLLPKKTTDGTPAPRSRRRLMTLRSIRWRLPLSYALIALVAALALGTVLIATLRDYYGQRETDYLERHAVGASMRIAEMLEAGVPTDAIQAQFESIGFLAQAHIRVLDAQRELIADSGSPDMQQVMVAYARRADGVPPDAGLPTSDYTSFIYLDRSGNTMRIARQTANEADTQAAQIIQALPAVSADAFSAAQPVVEAVQIVSPQPDAYAGDRLQSGIIAFNATSGATTQATFPFNDFRPPAGVWGMPLAADEVSATFRSDKRIEMPVVGSDGAILGYVEMFDGLAYGSAIVDRVTSGWLLASAVAVLLAASVGWFISRGLSAPLITLTEVTSIMAKGDLSARARLNRQDEIGRLAQSFNEMADRVEDTVSALRRFVGDAAHELHTPLTALNANLELAAQETDEARRSAFVQRAREQVQRMVTLSTDLLDLSRFESNRTLDDRSGVNLSAVVREMSEVYASRAEQKGISFSHDLPTPDVRVQANEGQLRRVVANLLDNAIKFTPEDGSVAVGLTTHAQQVELWVRDTGIGIPQEDLPLLFNRFHRGRNTAAFAGSGLGLAITRTIVEAHQGAVTVESGTHGTRFAVQLPATG